MYFPNGRDFQPQCRLLRMGILFRRFILTLPRVPISEMAFLEVPGRLALSMAALILVVTAAPAQDSVAAAAPERPATSGVFSEAQATRGEGVYQTSCQSCHAKTEYTGDKFKVAWVSRSAFDLFDVIMSQMPEDNPGSLERAQYVDVVAYILSLNAYPPGSGELPAEADALKKVRIDNPPSSLASRLAPRATRGTTHPRVTFRK